MVTVVSIPEVVPDCQPLTHFVDGYRTSSSLGVWVNFLVSRSRSLIVYYLLAVCVTFVSMFPVDFLIFFRYATPKECLQNVSLYRSLLDICAC